MPIDWDGTGPVVPKDVPKARISLVPPAHHTAADEVIDLCEMCGMTLLPWQEYALAAVFGEREDGTWAANEWGIVVPRQNGKSVLAAAIAIGGLFVLNENLIIYTAHQFKTAVEVFRLVDQHARSHPDVAALMKRTRWSHGEESIELKNGNRLKFLARTKSSGRGFGAARLLMDEALEMRDEDEMAALVPTMSAQPNAQMGFLSSAGDPGSLILQNIRNRAIDQSDPQLCYLEWSADPLCDVRDRQVWADSNPGYGEIITERAIERESMTLGLERFKQERLGIWATETVKAVIPWKEWKLAEERIEPPAEGEFTLAFDVTIDRTWSTIVVAWWGPEERPHTRISSHATGDAWLVDELARLAGRFNAQIGYDDVGPARDIADKLDRLGVVLRPMPLKEVTAAAAAYLSGVVNGTITHHPDQASDEAAEIATTRRVGDAWAWARRGAKAPVSPLVAASLAVWSLEHIPPPVEGEIGIW